MVLNRNRIIAGGMVGVSAIALAAGLWFQQWAVVTAALVLAAAVYGLLMLATLRRAGYLIVLARQNQELIQASISEVAQEQVRLGETLQRAALHDFRELFLSAFREVNEAVEALSFESKQSLSQQSRLEELVGRIDAVASSIDARVSNLGKRLDDVEREVDVRAAGVEQRVEQRAASLDSAMAAGFATGASRESLNGVSRQLEDLAHRADDLDKWLRADVQGISASISKVAKPVAKMANAIDRGDLRYPLLNDIASMNSLLRRFDPQAAVPRMSGWGIDACTLERIVELILRKRPRLLVECGSGSSTVWLAYAAREAGTRMVSLEHLDAYARETREELGRQGLATVAEVRLAPLKEIQLGDSRFNWYDPDKLADLDGLDFLIVDGPPKAVGESARFPALPMLHSRFAARGTVLFDDAHREDEARILELWRDAYPELTEPAAIGSRTVVMDWLRK